MPEFEEPILNPAEAMEDLGNPTQLDDVDNPLRRVENVYQLWWQYADFGLAIVSPHIPTVTPPVVWYPESLPGTSELEFVYPIYDYGYKLLTSKAQDMYTAGMSMCKLFFTIEKIIYLVIERLKTGGILGTEGRDEEGDTSQQPQIDVIFMGHEIAQRKGFETIINLQDYNLIVTNFDPGPWGERYLRTVKWLAQKGYGCPSKAPRDIFRQAYGTAPTLS